MDFFKSVFSADDSSPPGTPPPENDADAPDDADAAAGPQADPAPGASPSADPASPGTGPAPAAGWSSAFGGLIKTLSSKSESVIQNYRRDLEDFGAGLKKETAAIRAAASRALDAGAGAAQESLESVGQVVDELGDAVRRGTAELLHSIDSTDADEADPDPDPPSRGSARVYSRFEARVAAIQSDPSTFLEDPEDAEDFDKWRAGFQLAEKEEEISALKHENEAMEELLEKLVPEMVNYETFWGRYFYRVDRLRQAEDARAKLVKRVISRGEDEEELSWEIDDDDGNENKDDGDGEKEESKEEEDSGQPRVEAGQDQEIKAAAQEEVTKEVAIRKADSTGAKESIQPSQFPKVVSSGEADDSETPSTEGKADNAESHAEEFASKQSDVRVQEGKTEAGDSCKDSVFPVASSQSSTPEEEVDIDWGEIEDLGNQDEKKVIAPSLNPSVKVVLQKRPSSAENDEELSWDVDK